MSVPAGFWLGTRGPVEDRWRSAAAYGRFHAFAGLRPDGTLVLHDRDGDRLAAAGSGIDPTGDVHVRLTATTDGDAATLRLLAEQAGETVSVELELDALDLVGLLGPGTASSGSEDDNDDKSGGDARGVPSWSFASFSAAGDRLAAHPKRTFGPIGWTQHTHAGGVLKMTALMMPVGENDPQEVELLLGVEAGWDTAATSAIDPLSRCATFRVDLPALDAPRRYRVRYPWQGETFTYDGTLAPEPGTPGSPLKIAIMSCDWGYAFPNAPLVAAVAEHDPDLLVYAGDQIYEFFGKFAAEFEPLDRSTLDYLRKYALFGWINRELLRDRPSVIIPDDHDVFQGNIWGGGGVPRPPGTKDPSGGYRQPTAWVNAMQETQTWHLPDPADPGPIDGGIGVYFTGFDLGGVSFAVLEDRKWKTPYRRVWKNKAATPYGDVEALDPPGTELLGPRQEAFLAGWAQRDPQQLHVAISQTLFAKGHTHTGPKLRRIHEDFDTNGWPRTPRDRAVRLLGEARAIHLAGDQHVGLLAQLGVEGWSDGPLSFMVPGTVNGWPRAWWPDQAGTHRPPGAPGYTGRFVDDFGNHLEVLAAANPRPSSNLLDPKKDGAHRVARLRGSGFGLVTLDPEAKTARFEILRYPAVGDDPDGFRGDALFPGFPQTFERGPEGWERIRH